MSVNQVWDLEEIPKGAQTIGYKWVNKMKLDFKGNDETFKSMLMAKCFTQREGIHYNKTHYDLELHHIDVKIALLNSYLI